LLVLMASLGLAACQGIEPRDETADATRDSGTLIKGGTDSKDTSGSEDLLAVRNEAERLYRAKDYAKALPVYERLVSRVPKDALSWFQLGNTQARLQQNDQAIKSYEKAVQFDPALSKAWHNMGLLQLRQSANSFTQMAQLTREGDPLAGRAITLSQGTLALLDKNPASYKEPALQKNQTLGKGQWVAQVSGD
jgi:tetratricopeptide (TPR) repeat protein